MNKIYLLLFFFTNVFVCNAQDTLIYCNDESELVNIIEVSNTEIKFRKWNNLNGPNYIEKQSNISAINFGFGLKQKFEIKKIKQEGNYTFIYLDNDKSYYNKNEITPFGGTYLLQGRNKINKNQVIQLFISTTDSELIKYSHKAKQYGNRRYVGFAFLPLGIAALLMAIDGDSKKSDKRYMDYKIETSIAAVFGIAALFSIC